MAFMMTNNTSDDKVLAETAPAPRLLDQARDRLRVKHYSIRTEQAYLGWIKRFILFHGKRHPADMGKAEVESFLTALAVERNVAAATQGQALAAILFLYQEVLGQRLPWLDEVTRAKRPARLPTMLSQPEVAALLAAVDDPELAVVARLLYIGEQPDRQGVWSLPLCISRSGMFRTDRRQSARNFPNGKNSPE